ncbi:MAG: LysR family transcriptional regulator [Pseudomonadota bacterium]|uniref:DNA-binding transcriptional LysR family regulator n=1 Tax=Marinomonas communis TaxID=28254 RepID=A0A4R6XCS0_9GAMM|nr:LysR family transcriptional regulator [Marinomonas communis]MEC8081303.1 LysR family transcriptional regulator [Pseudomonadota bacterium]MEC8482560.1 LysR family transcriptional regulator [Pseudomonadota bacterium]TDR14753.1 DNA-binding transcriptional LysR family regulator [Marinomonas communis]
MMNESELPTSNSLLAFEATVRHGSMTAAADELGITQPLVSQRIRSLEEELGSVLLDRSRKPLKPTIIGEKFYGRIKEPIQLLFKACDFVKNERNDKKTRVSINVYFGFAFYWLMPRLNKLQEAFPDYVFEMTPTNSLSDMMVSSSDIVFHFSNSLGRYKFEEMFIREEVFPVCSPELLEKYEINVDKPLSDLRSLPLLHKDKDDARWFNWINWCKVLGVQPPEEGVIFCYNNYPLVLEAAIRGEGFCLAWRGLVDPYIKEGKLVELGPSLKSKSRGYLICTDYYDTYAIKKVVDWLIKEVESGDR